LKHIHLIGIGGSGLSAIARVLFERGYQVSGSDRILSPLALALMRDGVSVFEGHQPAHIQGADIIVRSSAIPDENPEVQAAMRAGLPVLKRSEFLGLLMEGYRCIAVAGTHGKTTTSAMVAWMLSDCGKDPSYILGSVSTNLGNNAHSGNGQDFVIEADEYDFMFLGLRPQIAVVTNIEHDHPDFFLSAAEYHSAFGQFASQIQDGGVLIGCADDPGAAGLLADGRNRGIRTRAYSLSNLKINGANGTDSKITYGDFRLVLQVPGVHNLLNALATLAVAEELEIPIDMAIASLVRFRGTSRRFEIIDRVAGVIVISDYAHHPTEIRATLAAALNRFPGHRIWAVWQPHTYSRTRQLAGLFAESFGDADFVVVTEIYAARESPPPEGFSSRVIVDEMVGRAASKEIYFVPENNQVVTFLLGRLTPGDVLLVLSAGDADSIAYELVKGLKMQQQDSSQGRSSC
jgi:UDP-N-acetylmuramate--alanine ligase